MTEIEVAVSSEWYFIRVCVSFNFSLVQIQSLSNTGSSVKAVILISWISTPGKLLFVVKSMLETEIFKQAMYHAVDKF